MTKTLLVLIVAAALSFVFPQTANALQRVNANTVRIRVLSYNIKGLPPEINWGWDADRFGDIGTALGSKKAAGEQPDIVLLQEAFSPRTVELAQNARYRYVTYGPEDMKPVDSGLGILSNFPIEYQQSIIYDDTVCGTWDCFASKGAMMARIRLPGVPFLLTIATTHSQSEDAYNNARKSQLQELARFLKSIFAPDAGLIIGGDFNTYPALPSYQDFKHRTGLTSVGEVCVAPNSTCAMVGETDRKILLDNSVDQFFYVNGRHVSIRPISVERTFQHEVNGRMLSDHPGYETVFEISWK